MDCCSTKKQGNDDCGKPVEQTPEERAEDRAEERRKMIMAIILIATLLSGTIFLILQLFL